MDSCLCLFKADLVEKKTGYPQLWSTEGEVILEGEASEA